MEAGGGLDCSLDTLAASVDYSRFNVPVDSLLLRVNERHHDTYAAGFDGGEYATLPEGPDATRRSSDLVVPVHNRHDTHDLGPHDNVQIQCRRERIQGVEP